MDFKKEVELELARVQGAEEEQQRIINLMNSHRVVIHPAFRVLECNKCGDVSDDQPSHLMRLIKAGSK
jgi:hypothetical protein